MGLGAEVGGLVAVVSFSAHELSSIIAVNTIRVTTMISFFIFSSLTDSPAPGWYLFSSVRLFIRQSPKSITNDKTADSEKGFLSMGKSIVSYPD